MLVVSLFLPCEILNDVYTEELEAPDPRQLCFVYRNLLSVRSRKVRN